MTSTKPAVRETAEPLGPEHVTAEGTGKRRLLPRAERRAQILSAAASAFAERGYSDTSMDEVANRAGITKLIVYRHFGSKAELYQAVLESVFGRLAEVLIDRIPDMVGQGAVPGALMSVAREQPDAMRLLMVHSAREPEFSELYRRYEAVAQSISALVLSDTGARELDRWQARMLAEFVTGGILNWVDDGDPARDEEVVKRLSQGARGMASAWRELPPEPAATSDES
ncbi:MAG: TetR/AcrR family transcriptional regulator [Microthrixaceae bacterium]